MSNRHTVTVHERTTAEWILDGVAVTAAVGCVGLAAVNYGSLPDTIAVHFGLWGEENGWGHKSFVWLLPGIIVVLVPFIIHLCRRPDKFNYPRKITPENAQTEYARVRLMLRVLNVYLGALFLLFTWEITHIGANVLGPWLLPVVVGGSLFFLIFFTSSVKNRADKVAKGQGR